jgi:uncharacterized membrane protein
MRVPNPRTDPATAGTLSVGGIASLIVIELKQRFGIDVTLDEALLVVTAAIALYHVLGGPVKPK